GSSAFPPRAPDRDPARRTVGHLGPPFVQNARLRAGIEKETEGATLISTRHGPPAIPIAPLQQTAIPHRHANSESRRTARRLRKPPAAIPNGHRAGPIAASSHQHYAVRAVIGGQFKSRRGLTPGSTGLAALAG